MNTFISIALLFGVLVASRLIGMPDNFTPLMALAVFLPRLGGTALIPVGVLAVTDALWLGWYSTMPVVYACMALASIVSVYVRNLYVAGVTSVLLWHVLVNSAVAISGGGYWPFTPETIIFDFRLLCSTIVFLALFDQIETMTRNYINGKRSKYY